ncbi:MAG: hypothetical protein KF785_08665 [Gemmatimonadales bacterium]|nr:hypothetical protein [Gemmatimonadales bacterium]
MPKNRVIYLGLVLVVATALVWLGAEFTRRVEPLLPYTIVVGIALLVIGAGTEVYRKFRKERTS